MRIDRAKKFELDTIPLAISECSKFPAREMRAVKFTRSIRSFNAINAIFRFEKR